MANWCWVEMEVVGKQDDIKNFVSAIRQEGDVWIGRGMDADHDGIVPINNTGFFQTKLYGDTKWSVQSALIDIVKGEKTEYLDLMEACKKFNVDIELYSSEPGMKFQEHIAIIKGEKIIDECEDAEEFDLQYFKDVFNYSKKQAEEEFGIEISQADWDSGEIVRNGGFPDWGDCHEIAAVVESLKKNDKYTESKRDAVRDSESVGIDYSKPERNALKENKSVSENIPAKQVDVGKER